jgi:hypothetical protein
MPDGFVDGTGQRHSGQLTMRDDHPASRVPALRPDGAAQQDRTPRNGFRQPAAGEKARPGRVADQLPNWQGPGVPGSAVQAPPPVPTAVPAPVPAAASLPPASGSPARLEPPPDIGYKVLPKSYWSGASWRWRTKRDDDPQ